jgi:hypothetical protein
VLYVNRFPVLLLLPSIVVIEVPITTYSERALKHKNRNRRSFFYHILPATHIANIPTTTIEAMRAILLSSLPFTNPVSYCGE